jgi:hypothetical protein
MDRRIAIVGTTLLTMVFISWQLNYFPRFQQQQDTTKSQILNTSITPFSSSQRTILVKNNIEPNMLQYTHWSGTYEPTTFIITVNGKEVKPNREQKITIIDNQFVVRVDYSFLNGKRKGAKIIRFTTNTDHPLLNLSFSWADQYQIVIDNATACAIKEEPFNEEYSL